MVFYSASGVYSFVMGNKLRVGILFGGKSAEHEVSLQSAKNVYDAIDRGKFLPHLIGIGKDGRWLSGDDENFIIDSDDPQRIRINPSCSAVDVQTALSDVDVVFPILHGPFGEDGTVQGLLKLLNIPFVGAGVLASAAGMDKDVMKRLLLQANLPVGKLICLKENETYPAFDTVCSQLGVPFFVKPANMGSSVGVCKVRTEQEYSESLTSAFQYDTKALLEEFIPGREIECSVLGAAPDVSSSIPGEIKPHHEFYSYNAKYLDEHGAALIIPADLPEQTAARIRELSIAVFNALCCEGLARVDFFLKEDGSIIVNEINTMPGFTRISMYPKLWEASGLSYTKLIDRLIELALARFEKEQRLKTSV